MSPIECVHSTVSRSRCWSNVVTVHRKENVARLWSTRKLRLEEAVLEPATVDAPGRGNVSCAVISQCGHYVFLGRVSGVIDGYNVQSALHRVQIGGAHGEAVRALHLSQFNNVLISLGADSWIKFWNVGGRRKESGKAVQCQFAMDVGPEVIARSSYDARSNVLAVATDQLRVHIFDAVCCSERRCPLLCAVCGCG